MIILLCLRRKLWIIGLKKALPAVFDHPQKNKESSMLPELPGGKTRKIYYEVAQHGDKKVGFAK
jgi:hypothetical protein